MRSNATAPVGMPETRDADEEKYAVKDIPVAPPYPVRPRKIVKPFPDTAHRTKRDDGWGQD